AEQDDKVGVATGVAWTETGGDTMSIEVSAMKGGGKLILTGKLGEVMRESAQAGYTYVRSKARDLGIPDDFYEKMDVHIHVPEGAIPKDGPSAGITMATALASALSGVSVRHEVAMTGEITLRGRVLPVGGLKEKVLAAHRAGITTIIIPEDNRKDLEEIPENVRADITFVEVSHMDEVLAVALARYGASDTDRLQDDLESDEDHVHAAVMVPPTNPPSTHQPPAAL
ncbi:MAG TPA: magnesium chelatase domain-containing protein, partial [Bacillota bacterium]|nr:magnesium chelatase domain-containing protein [Bacillota bacterium]